MFVSSEGKTFSSHYLAILDANEGDPSEFVGELGTEIWKDPIIVQGYKSLPQNSLPETTIYFLDSIERIHARHYRPTDEGDLILLTF